MVEEALGKDEKGETGFHRRSGRHSEQSAMACEDLTRLVRTRCAADPERCPPGLARAPLAHSAPFARLLLPGRCRCQRCHQGLACGRSWRRRDMFLRELSTSKFR